MRFWLFAIATLVSACALACSRGEKPREIQVVMRTDSCSPTPLSLAPGERVKLIVKNDAGADRELEGIDGTKFDEVHIPPGRTMSFEFTMPPSGTTQKLKCYAPGATSTIIELVNQGQPVAAIVRVDLAEWTVKPAASAAPVGRVRFVAHNESTTMTHSLAVLAILADGQKRELQQVKDVKPGSNGEFTVELAHGRYELACLIVPGEVGSKIDHYQQGMHTDFTIQ
jgi:uncharacterized cupredoxin-like copper-binding protein